MSRFRRVSNAATVSHAHSRDSCRRLTSAYSPPLIQMPLFSRCRMQPLQPLQQHQKPDDDDDDDGRHIPGARWPQGIVWLPSERRHRWAGHPSGVAGDPCIYMRNLSGIRNDVARGRRGSAARPSPSIVRRAAAAAPAIEAATCPARRGRRREGGGRADGRREKFNHETFMRRRVLTIRRQIAKRRRSEIIRNLQLTGAGRGRAA